MRPSAPVVSLFQGATRGLIPSWRLPARVRGPWTSRSPNCSPHPPRPSAPCPWVTPSLRKSQGGRSPLCPQEKARLVTCPHSPRDPALPHTPAVPGQAPPSRRGPLHTCSRCLTPQHLDVPIQKPLSAAPGSVRGSPAGSPTARALHPSHKSAPSSSSPPGRELAAECSGSVAEHTK